MGLQQFDKALKDYFVQVKGFPSFKKKMLLKDSCRCLKNEDRAKVFNLRPQIVAVK